MSILSVSAIETGHYALSGDMTMATVSSAWPGLSSLWNTRNSPELIDFSGVKQIDSAGLAWLVHIVAAAKKSDKTIKFINTPSSILKLAKISDVSSLLPLE